VRIWVRCETESVGDGDAIGGGDRSCKLGLGFQVLGERSPTMII
jgi:hypothetical protein